MFVLKDTTYRYYRFIPKGLREQARAEYVDNWRWMKDKNRAKNPPSKVEINRIIRQPLLYQRNKGNFRGLAFVDIEPDVKGGITECHMVFEDDKTGEQVVFISKVKCSKKDNFVYKIGREMATKAALALHDQWEQEVNQKCCESSS